MEDLTKNKNKLESILPRSADEAIQYTTALPYCKTWARFFIYALH